MQSDGGAVTYQDLKVRDTLRLLAIGAACTVITVAIFACRDVAQPFLERVPIMRHNAFDILLSVLPVMALACLGVSIQYLVTTPEQNARFILKAKASLPPSLSDVDNPDYRTPTWRYVLRRLQAKA